MTEDVLYYIWKTQSFKNRRLATVNGESVNIIHPGILNDDSGPDFSSARILIKKIEWIGDVEIHLKSSFWNAHKHQHDLAYNKVILHIVWQHDLEVERVDGTKMPTLELHKLVDKDFLDKYELMMKSMDSIICSSFFKEVDSISKLAAYNKLLVERLERKSEVVLKQLSLLNGDWEQVSLHLLFEYFGFKKNNDAFKQLAQLIDNRIIGKLVSLEEVEAYLFGLGGFLTISGKKNEYLHGLQEKFKWLQRKFNINSSPMTLTWWKFMRMRPANFPTLKIAQLSALIFQKKHLFKSLLEATHEEAGNFFRVEPSTFWKTHYHFNKISEASDKRIGIQGGRNLSINVAATLLMAYGISLNDSHFKEKAISFLEEQKPEDNSITRKWKSLGIKMRSASDSQGSIELYTNYCIKRRCLECSIGHRILRT